MSNSTFEVRFIIRSLSEELSNPQNSSPSNRSPISTFATSLRKDQSILRSFAKETDVQCAKEAHGKKGTDRPSELSSRTSITQIFPRSMHLVKSMQIEAMVTSFEVWLPQKIMFPIKFLLQKSLLVQEHRVASLGSKGG